MSLTIAVSQHRSTKTYPFSPSNSQHSPTTSTSSPELTAGSTVAHSDDEDSHSDTSTSPAGSFTRPKIEELDDDMIDVYDVEDAKDQLSPVSPAPRKRGRPRKYPKNDSLQPKKASHARSKTGCGTCRKRKKKCDETKPGCMNCKKNNVTCDGYEPTKPWQAPRRLPKDLPILINAVEHPVDMVFLEHFVSQLGNVLSLTDKYNPFKEIIVPMAMQHPSLMHSVLFLSGSCLTAKDAREDWQERQIHHNNKAITLLRESLDQPSELVVYDHSAFPNGDPTIAQTLILFLQTVCSGAVNGEYRLHLQGMKTMLTEANFTFPNEKLRQFLLEFIIYHDYCASITSLVNPIDSKSEILMDLRLPQYMIQPAAGTLLGVFDGMFKLISRIRCLRDKIREQRTTGHKWYEAHILSEAYDIDNALRNWTCTYSQDNPRYACSLLYRQCTWIYLYRTVQPSLPCQTFETAVDQGLEYLACLPMDAGDSSMQSVLLMPLFLLGCAAFEPRQRPPISSAFDQLQEWSGLANIKYARAVVHEVWRMMDDGLEQETWDWESIIASNGWDFLIT